MKTIEERASTASWPSETAPLTIPSAHVVGYIQGATEQREIDIRRTCKWLYDNLDWGFMETNNFISKFKQAMKEE